MPDKLHMDLSDFEIETIDPVSGGSTEASLESLFGGHALAETAASCEVCSCCVACCCCCCS